METVLVILGALFLLFLLGITLDSIAGLFRDIKEIKLQLRQLKSSGRKKNE